MTIRVASLPDFPQLVALFEGYRAFYEKAPAPEAALQFLTERLTKGESQVYVAEDADGTLTGFVQLYPLFSSTRLQRLWLLNDLFVHPAHRGRGISVLLIEQAKQWCIQTGSAGMFLETARTNTIGNELYPRTGFTLDEEHHYYCWDTPTT